MADRQTSRMFGANHVSWQMMNIGVDNDGEDKFGNADQTEIEALNPTIRQRLQLQW